MPFPFRLATTQNLFVAQLGGAIDLWRSGTVTHASLHRSGLQQGICRTTLVAINDKENVTTYDSVSSGDCSYDGHLYRRTEVPDDFSDDYLSAEQLAASVEAYL